MRGTWQTTSGGGDGLVALLVLAGVLFGLALLPPLLTAAGVVVAALAKLVLYALLGLAAVIAAGAFACRAWRKGHPPAPAPFVTRARQITAGRQAALPSPAPRAIGPPVTVNIITSDPDTVAAAIRAAHEGRSI